jgi:hypothetical protein
MELGTGRNGPLSRVKPIENGFEWMGFEVRFVGRTGEYPGDRGIKTGGEAEYRAYAR